MNFLAARRLPTAARACAGAALLALGDGWGQAATDLAQAAQIRVVPPEAGRLGERVRMQGIITFRDQDWNFLLVQDASGGVFVRTATSDLPLALGSQVEVEGVTDTLFGGIGIDQPTVRLLAQGGLPEPKPATLADLLAGRFDAQRVVLEGAIRSSGTFQNRATLHLHAGSNHIDVLLRGLSSTDPLLTRLVGCDVRVHGIGCQAIKPGGEELDVYLLIASTNDITILRPAEAAPFSGPVVSINDVTFSDAAHRIRLLARIQTPLSNRMFLVEDPTGTIWVRPDKRTPARAGDVADIVGFPSIRHGQQLLDHAVLQVLAPPQKRLPSEPADSRLTNQYLPVVHSIDAVRRLPEEEANRGHPVRLSGVVTFYDARAHYLFIRDATNGIFVWPAETNLPVRVSDIVEVTGFTSAGRYAPVVVDGRVTRYAAGELPPPRVLPFAQLLSGQHDCDWVAMEGIVRSATTWEDKLVLKVAAVGGTFTALVTTTNAVPTAKLVDAEVRFHGVCGTEANSRRQLIGVKIFVPSPAEIIIKTQAPENPFALPVRSLASLMSFQTAERIGHRVRVHGVVTRQRRPDAFFIRDGTAPAWVRLLEPLAVQPGDAVEIVGFPELAGASASLHDAVIRKRGSAPVPAPRAVVAGPVAGVNHDADLVTVQARLVNAPSRPGRPLVLQANNGFVFEAPVAETNSFPALRRLAPGNLLQLTGICSSKSDEAGSPRTFRMLLTAASDVLVLERAPWWTPRHAFLLAGLLGGLILAALGWAVLLRRQVGKQTAVIRELNTGLERRVVERTAELEAANRELESFSYSVSHDLRAPLRAVNGFAEVLLQTHGTQLDEKGSRYLRHVADGGRRMGRLVDDLLSFSRLGRQPLTCAPLDLNPLVAQVVEDLRRQDPRRQVDVRLEPLPPAEGDRALLHQVLTNLISNAWKFTTRQPDPRIEVGALPHGPSPVYFVRDNGAGFDMKYANKLFGVFQRLHRDEEFPGTGVGLAIVQRILQRHGGRVWAESQPGAGATFYFTLPAASPRNEPCAAFGK